MQTISEHEEKKIEQTKIEKKDAQTATTDELERENERTSEIQQTEHVQVNEQEQATTETQHSTTQKDNISNHLQSYWSHVKAILSRPSSSFDLSERNVHYDIINLILYAVLFTLTAIFIFRAELRSMMPMDNIDIPYMEIFFKLVITMIIYVAAIVVGTFLVDTLFIKRHTFKQLMTKFGSFIAPILVLQLINIVFALTGSLKMTFFLLLTSLFLLVFIFPSLFIFHTAQQQANVQKVYISVGTIFVNGFFVYIAMKIIVSIFVEELYEEFQSIFTYLFW